jgi:hypothetical protein
MMVTLSTADQRQRDAAAFEEIRKAWRNGLVLERFPTADVTGERFEDAPALDAYLRGKVPKKMNLKINLAIVQGTDVGPPPANCSFCGKGPDEVGRLIGAERKHVRICGPCARAASALAPDTE